MCQVAVGGADGAVLLLNALHDCVLAQLGCHGGAVLSLSWVCLPAYMEEGTCSSSSQLYEPAASKRTAASGGEAECMCNSSAQPSAAVACLPGAASGGEAEGISCSRPELSEAAASCPGAESGGEAGADAELENSVSMGPAAAGSRPGSVVLDSRPSDVPEAVGGAEAGSSGRGGGQAEQAGTDSHAVLHAGDLSLATTPREGASLPVAAAAAHANMGVLAAARCEHPPDHNAAVEALPYPNPKLRMLLSTAGADRCVRVYDVRCSVPKAERAGAAADTATSAKAICNLVLPKPPAGLSEAQRGRLWVAMTWVNPHAANLQPPERERTDRGPGAEASSGAVENGSPEGKQGGSGHAADFAADRQMGRSKEGLDSGGPCATAGFCWLITSGYGGTSSYNKISDFYH